MKQILLFSLFFLPLFTTAQNIDFAPVGAYWRYNWVGVVSAGEAVAKITGDTVINGRALKKIDMTKYQYPPSGYPRGITQTYRLANVEIRNDSFFAVSGQNNTLLYTTNIRLGDTIKFSTVSNYTRYALTDSFGTVNRGGVTSRVVYYTQYCLNKTNGQLRSYGNPRITEDFSLLGQLFFRPQPDCGFIDDNHYSLNCYQAGNLRYPINQICTPTVATNDVIDAHQIIIAPNPVSNDLQINYPSELQLNRVELTNYLGQTISVYSSVNNQKVSVSNVPNGVYFLSLRFDNQQVVKKIVIQH